MLHFLVVLCTTAVDALFHKVVACIRLEVVLSRSVGHHFSYQLYAAPAKLQLDLNTKLTRHFNPAVLFSIFETILFEEQLSISTILLEFQKNEPTGNVD